MYVIVWRCTSIIITILASFVISYSFSILYNVPKSEYVYCGICGAIGCTCFLLITSISNSNALFSCFFTSVLISFFSRVIANIRKKPVIIFLLPGIITLVPGAAIFDAMFSVIDNKHLEGLTKAIYTFQTAGVIGLGIIIIFSFPEMVFKKISLLIKK